MISFAGFDSKYFTGVVMGDVSSVKDWYRLPLLAQVRPWRRAA
jgi:hypothetical protein